MEWITHDALAKRTHYLRIEDLIYLPEELDIYEAEDVVFAIKTTPELRECLSGSIKDVRDHHPQVIVEIVKLACVQHMQKTGELPGWLDLLPKAFSRVLSIENAYQDIDLNHFAILPQSSFARLPYMVLDDGLVAETVHAFKLFRLAGIAQLGFLHDAIVDEFGQTSTLGWTYSHTRYHHVLNTMAIMTLMMRNNGIDGIEFATGRVAALTHDVLTPARGDTTKLLDYEAFDEDKHYPEVFERYELDAFIKNNGIDPDLLVRTVQGKGALGSLLNYADKLAYITTDLERYTKNPRTALLEPDPIVILAEKNPFLCTIWDDVRVANHEVYFTDQQRLTAFLYTRAVMFQQFYWHPRTRFLEFVVGAVLLKYLYKTGKINREMLLGIDDSVLDAIMAEELGLPGFSWTSNVFGEPCVELFDSHADAKARETELMRQGVIFTIIENLPRSFRVGTHIKVKSADGIVPLTVANPGASKFLQSKSKLPYPYRLYYITELRAGDKFLTAFKAYKQEMQKSA
ncbi:MAG: hypothetical protein P1P90_05300 [Patescibacteria group bacterium]|nr:hypothetical protein [Patescibacteria group bacterium]